MDCVILKKWRMGEEVWERQIRCLGEFQVEVSFKGRGASHFFPARLGKKKCEWQEKHQDT